MHRFSPKVVEQLRFYVYVYIDPRNERPFYIGKGKGNRVFAHLAADDDSEKTRILRELADAKTEPRIELLKYGLTEKEALLVEATAIDLIEISNLSNAARGHGSRYGARASVEEIQATLNAEPVSVAHPSLLININRGFRYGMSTIELYDATRSAWKLGPKRDTVDFAMSVYRGVVREVYRVVAWHAGGETMRQRDTDGRSPKREGRWEFVGHVAEEPIRRQYAGKSVAHEFPAGSQNPVKYAGVP